MSVPTDTNCNGESQNILFSTIVTVIVAFYKALGCGFVVFDTYLFIQLHVKFNLDSAKATII